MNNFFQPRQMGQLILSHFRELIREPGVLFWGIGFPILLSLGLGVAFMQKRDMTRTVAVITQDTETERILRGYAEPVTVGSGPGDYRLMVKDADLGNTTFIFQKSSWPEAMLLLKRGIVNVVLEAKEGRMAYHFDPQNPDAQLCYLKLSKAFNKGKASDREIHDPITPLTLPGARYIDFLVPGLMAMGIMMSCLWGISYGLIEKRSKKLLRRMIATPMRKSHFLISLIAVRLSMNVVESGLLFLFAFLFFHITLQGNPIALILLFIAGNAAFSGIAVLLACRTSNTEIGNGLISAVSMPLMVLSGVFFSYHNFPEWSLPIIQNFPLALLADGMRSVFIEGAGITGVLMPTAILSITGILLFAVGLRLFRWN